jgi:4-hydroxy-tetrahydrodipicolinate reductase
MSDLLGVAITGVSGRMGQMLVESVHASETATLVGALERPDHPWVGQDLGRVMQKSETGLIVQDKAENVFAHADVVIDFTSPAATVAFAKQAAQTGTAHVIGTTGLSDEDLAAVAKAAEKTVIVRAGNMSLGVNLLVQLTKKVAAALDEDFDIEVIEAHHNKKVDAPSGTI